MTGRRLECLSGGPIQSLRECAGGLKPRPALSCRSPRSAVGPPPPAEEEEKRRRRWWRYRYQPPPPPQSARVAAIARLLPATGALRRCRKGKGRPARGAAVGGGAGEGAASLGRDVPASAARPRGGAAGVGCRSARGAEPGRAAGPLAGAAGGSSETGGKERMDMGNQHPSIKRLHEIQKEVKEIEQQVVVFSGLSTDRDYKKLERSLTKQLFEIDSVDTEGKGDIQQARKRAAQETERLLKELEQNANHPRRLEIEAIFKEAQALVEREITPFYKGGNCISDEFEEGIQDIVLRLTQVKTGGKVSLRKARYRTLTKVCAVQEIIESCVKQQLSLPLSNDAHPSVSKINSVMCDVNKARGTLIALLMGVSSNDTCRHLSCVLTGLIADLDALDVCGRAEIRNYRKEVVEEINKLQKYLDLEEEANSTHAYDLAQNQSILKIEEIRKKMKEVNSLLLKTENASDLYLGSKAELQGLIACLDEVSPGKNPCIREARRRAVIEVQTLITYIDLKEALEKRQMYSEQTAAEHQSHKAVWTVLGNLSQIQQEVISFDGNRTDKNYMRLEELLTKQLLALDAVDPQGDERCKAARKQAVKLAQNILYYLDMKTDEWEY